MRICGTIVCLNEIDYLPYAIRSMYPVCDKIIVVEAANRFSRDFATPNGLSTDGATEAILTYPDPAEKIEHIPFGFSHCLAEPRNTYMEQIANGDLIVMADADELYISEQLQTACDFLMQHPEIPSLLVKPITFWGDFDHHLQDEWYCAKLYWKQPGDHFLCAATGDLGDFHSRQEELNGAGIRVEPDLLLFHTGWVREVKRLFTKTLYTYRYNQAFPEASNYAQLRGLTEEELMWEILLNNHCFTRRLPRGMILEKYLGPWPEILREHPFWNKTEREIFREEEYRMLLRQMAEKYD